MPRKIIIICGTTATGKTALAHKIAASFSSATIISIDSRQFYADLGIVTGVDLPDSFERKLSSSICYLDTPGVYFQKGKIKLWGLDTLSPEISPNLSDFVQYVWKIVASLPPDETVILVGGTGLYLKAITSPLPEIHIPRSPALREKISTLKISELQDTLMRQDLNRFNIMNQSDRSNPRRLIRQLEIIASECTVIPKFNYFKLQESSQFIWLGLKAGEEDLPSLINARVVSRLTSGALKEVSDFLANFPDSDLPIYSTLGVSQCQAYINGQITKETLISDWTASELSYAKRQLTWFKKQSGIIWYDREEPAENIISDLIQWQKS